MVNRLLAEGASTEVPNVNGKCLWLKEWIHNVDKETNPSYAKQSDKRVKNFPIPKRQWVEFWWRGWSRRVEYYIILFELTLAIRC